MRKFIRHPSSIPVHIQRLESSGHTGSQLVNVSYGGLALHFPERLENGTQIELTIDSVDPEFRIKGVVVWSREKEDGFDLGIRFRNDADTFQMRMVEQVCHIEHYRNEVALKQGRQISSEEAAAEWIGKFAGDFPRLDETSH
ncbi:MAG: PilZ domain-containing protein [Gammaproteobacteria bacterium]|nr:PilZ domain-containing protein [Gammaproteobacteria bacterium]